MSAMAGRARFTCACGAPARARLLTLTIRNSNAAQDAQELAKFVCDNGIRDWIAEFERRMMPETLAAPTKPSAPRGNAADMRVLAQVEKWMAVIREIKQQPARN